MSIFKSRKVWERLHTVYFLLFEFLYSLILMFMSDASIIFSKSSYLCHCFIWEIPECSLHSVLVIHRSTLTSEKKKNHLLSSTLLYCISVKEPDGLTLSKGHCDQSFLKKKEKRYKDFAIYLTFSQIWVKALSEMSKWSLPS